LTEGTPVRRRRECSRSATAKEGSTAVNLKILKTSLRLPASSKKLFEIDSFVFSAGQSYLIEGPSGAGKTSFLHSLAGLLPVDSEGLLYDDINLLKLSLSARADFRRQKLGLIFQKLSLIDHFTALENILLDPVTEEAALTALEILQIKDKASTIVSRLSLGEQQRVAIARVLAKHPQVILADEPTSSLDDKNTELVIDNLLKIAEGKLLIVVSHDQRLKPHFKNNLTLSGGALSVGVGR
jgi:putative ABC transport system ATP-binding protein